MLQVQKETVDFLVTTNMIKEVESFLEVAEEKIAPIIEEMQHRKIKTVYFVGGGSSKAVGDAGQYLFNKYSCIHSHAYTGWEFVDHTPKAVNEEAMVILISQSGKTEEVVEALRKANNLNAFTVAVVNKATGNPLGEEAKVALAYHAEAMWECQLVAVYLLALTYIQKIEPNRETEKILADLPKLPQVLKHHIETFEEKALSLTKDVGHWKGFYTIAAGPLVSLAYKEGVITNMEFMWGHGAVIESGEFRHGPLEIVEKGVPFLFLVGTDASRHITERALRFVQKYEGETVVLDYQDFSMGLHADLSPMVMFVPLEWFSYYFALVRDHHPDHRRYYNVVQY